MAGVLGRSVEVREALACRNGPSEARARGGSFERRTGQTGPTGSARGDALWRSEFLQVDYLMSGLDYQIL